MENNNSVCCLLCLDTFNEIIIDDENGKDLRKTLFALINYLSTSRSKDINTDSDVQSVIFSSACKVCLECENLLETFTSLLKQLEIAKLKVDSCVRQIRDVLLEGNKFEGEDIKYSSKLKSFRRCLLGKANLEIKKTDPTVRLQRSQFSSASRLPHFSKDTTVVIPVEAKLEIKDEPKKMDENDVDTFSMEIDLGMPFSNVKSERADVNPPETSGKSDWECCNCDNPPESDPPVLYYNVKCVQAQSEAENIIPHFMCKSCKDGAEKSTESVFHRKCPKCGEIGAWVPEDLRPIFLSDMNSVVRWIKPEQHFKHERSKTEASENSEAGKAQRQLVHELLSKLENDPLKSEDEQKQAKLEKELSEYCGRKKSSGHGHGYGLEEAFKLVNEQEQEWLAQVKWALLQKLKNLKAERMEWTQMRKFFGRKQCTFCLKSCKTKSERDYHVQTTHKKPLLEVFCTVPGCRYSTTCPSNMKRHMNQTNCPQKDSVGIRKCKFCGKPQSRPKRLKEHEERCKKNPMHFAYAKKRRLERKMKAAARQNAEAGLETTTAAADQTEKHAK